MTEYIISTIGITSLSGFLIVMIYRIRSHITIPKGPYTWISNFCIFTLFLIVIIALFLGLAYTSPTDVIYDDEQNFELGKKPVEYEEELSILLSTFISKNAMFPILVVKVVIYVCLNVRLVWIW